MYQKNKGDLKMYLNEERRTRRETPETAHNIILENRNKLTVSGVTEVESFHEEKIVLMTSEGKMTVTGKNMHIKQLHVETGDVLIFGQVDTMAYMTAQTQDEKNGWLAKLFK